MPDREIEKMKKILEKFEESDLAEGIRGLTADDEDWDAGCILPLLVDMYAKSDTDVREGIDRTCEIIFGYVLKDLVESVEEFLEDY